MVDPKLLPYRQGVGLCVFNRQGQILCAERRDRAGSWQMPQGGVQKGEDLQIAALRELKEEIGTNNVRMLARHPEILRYEFPDFMQYRGGVFCGKYKGQEQTWFAALFLGQDEEIDLSGEHEPELPEFVAWRWQSLASVPEIIVPFKKPVYEAVALSFAPLAQKLQNGEELPAL